MDGGRAVEAITQISETAEGVWVPGFEFFGVPLPTGIARCELRCKYKRGRDFAKLHWITKYGEKHSMPFEQTHEGITAALVAMKLSC